MEKGTRARVGGAERASEYDGLSKWIARFSFSPVPVGRPFSFRADFDGAFPGLKAWAVLLNRFAVRSNRLVYKAQRRHFRPGAPTNANGRRDSLLKKLLDRDLGSRLNL